MYLHILGCYGEKASRNPYHRPANVKQINDWTSEMVEKLLAFWLKDLLDYVTAVEYLPGYCYQEFDVGNGSEQ